MRDNSTLGSWLRRFLTEHLVSERNLSRNTQLGYRDTFTLLLPCLAEQVGKPPERLAVRDLGSEQVLAFLAGLAEQRACSPQTCNQRLAAIRAFARFVASRDPEHLEWAGRIRAISAKRADPPPVHYLEKHEMDALLAVPDRTTAQGCREYAVLVFLYNTGARVSELTRLTVGDLQLADRPESHSLVTLHGKRGRIRRVPVWPSTATVLSELAGDRPATRLRVPQPDWSTVHTVWHPRTGQTVRRGCRAAGTLRDGEGRQLPHPAPQLRHSSVARRCGSEHDPCLARPRQRRYHEHLCRGGSRDQGPSDRLLRPAQDATGTAMEGGQGPA